MAFTSFRFASALAGGQLIKHSTTTRQVALNGNIQSRTFYGIYEKYMEAFKRYGWKGTLWKLYNPGDVKFGKLVGEDQFGNKYYEDTTELHGQQRWTEFKVDTFEDFEGSNIPPEWHMWLQQMTDAKPGEPGQDPKNWPKRPVSSVSDAPYANHLGPCKPYEMHKTLFRARGYGVGSHLTKPNEPDQYYIQRGHALRNRKRKAHFFDGIDYNNPDKPSEESSESLRDPALP